MRDQKTLDIFLSAHDLFRKKGYAETTMREIAASAGVSLGLPNHLFGSKQGLAAEMLRMLVGYIGDCCKGIVPDIKESPLLYTASHTRANTAYFLGSSYRTFYLDCLRENVFFEIINDSDNYTLRALAETYRIPVNEDLFTLYGKYLPYQCEKTLVLHKEAGEFSDIGYDDIPDYIIRCKFEHFLDTALLEPELKKAHELAGKAMERTQDPVPESFVRAFISGNGR